MIVIIDREHDVTYNTIQEPNLQIAATFQTKIKLWNANWENWSEIFEKLVGFKRMKWS